MTKIFLLLILSALSLGVQAQQGAISGRVVLEDAEMLELVKVKLYSLPDSNLIGGALLDEKGDFTVKADAGLYFLKITCLDYEDVETIEIRVNAEATENLIPVSMVRDASLDLDEVIATGSLDVLKAGIDKKIYNVEDDISTRGGSASDVLDNIPSIDIDQDGNISLRGDGNVTVLIDGRPSALVAGDGQNLLDALPANSIERIEVVTNPSAKYDPDGTSGIINIVMKKNKLKGMNGIVSGSAATGNQYSANLGLSYRNNKLNVFMNYSLNYYEGYRNVFTELTQDFGVDSLNFLDQNREGTDLKSSHTLVFGMDYDFNKRNALGFSLTGSTEKRVRTGQLESSLFDQNDLLLSRWDRESEDPRNTQNADLNLNFTHKLKDSKGKWSVNANQSYGGKKIEGYYHETYLNADGTSIGLAPLDQQLFNTSQLTISTFQTDFEYILEKIKARIETGAKAVFRSDNETTFSERQDSLTQLYVADSLANFDYAYDEKIYSVYGIFGQELGKLSYQAGVRVEYALQTPNLISSNEIYENKYFNLFPSAHLKYQPSKATELSLSYSRRINRAKSRQMNPFTSYANPFNLRRGNPELQPEYIDSYDLGYSYTKTKLIFSASVFHRRTKDVINRVKVYFPDNSSMVTYDNIDESVSTGLETIIIYKPFKWMKNQISLNGNYIDYTNADSTVNWNNDGLNWGVKYSLSVDFWNKSATAQLNSNYSAPRVTPQGIILSRTEVDFAIEKRLFDKKLSVGMKVTDIFNTKGFRLELEQDGIVQRMEFKWLTRRFFVTASYRFGSLDKKMKAPRISGGGGGM